MTTEPRTPPPADPAAVLAVLRTGRAGLITDIDGTISPLASTPDAATTDPRARAALVRLLPRLALVAALTGRRATDGARLVGIPGLLVVGNHGMETLRDGTLATEPRVLPYVAPIGRVLARLREHPLPDGTLIEEKGPTASVHYRLAPDWVAARAGLLAALAPLVAAEGVLLTEGKALFEIRPPVPINKGHGLRRLVTDHALDAAVMLGDDLTDVDAFHALWELRDAGRVRGLTVGVVLSPEEGDTAPAVIAAADVVVRGVAGVADLLTALADGLEAAAPGHGVQT